MHAAVDVHMGTKSDLEVETQLEAAWNKQPVSSIQQEPQPRLHILCR